MRTALRKRGRLLTAQGVLLHHDEEDRDQNQDVKAGNVTSAEKISPDVKVDAVDSRKEDLERRTRRRRLDTKA